MSPFRAGCALTGFRTLFPSALTGADEACSMGPDRHHMKQGSLEKRDPPTAHPDRRCAGEALLRIPGEPKLTGASGLLPTQEKAERTRG